MQLELQKLDGRELYIVRRDDVEVGYVAVDSKVGGRARGGLRMMPDVGADEMRDAARAMTLKYGFLGLPQGGAKAGVRADPEVDSEIRREHLLEFGRGIESLLFQRIYIPDADMGTSAGDIRWMMEKLGAEVGKRDWRENLSGFYTAVSCRASAEAILDSRGSSLAGRTVAIEGFGSVGANLARLMVERGARIVGISTSRGGLFNERGLDVDKLTGEAKEQGSEFVLRSGQGESISCAELLELEVDLLCPCARRHSIHRGNLDRVRAQVVCAGANNPVEPLAEQALSARGMVIPPDFVSNSGGVLGGTLQFAGASRRKIVSAIEQLIAARLERYMEMADRAAKPLREVIESAALARHREIRRAADSPNLAARIFATGLEAYRRGLIPKAFVSGLAPLYLRHLARCGDPEC